MTESQVKESQVSESQVSESLARPAFYALERGGWRDYVTLLHLPYTAWHLSYVVIGACLAPIVAWNRTGAVVAAFALALGVGAHALDELNGRPLQTEIPSGVLVALAAASVLAASAIGLVVALTFELWLALLVPIGVFLVLAYNLELAGGRFHTDLWFGLAWGGFPLLCGYAAVAGEIRVEAVLAAAFAVLHSLAQRTLSSEVRLVRRRAVAVRGELELDEGGVQPIDAGRLTGPAEQALRLLSVATVLLAVALLASRV